jgi:hypothetical protein
MPNMLKRLPFLTLLLLAGCVTHYHAPPRTVVYRDVHGLTSGVYDNQAEYIAPGINGRVVNYGYYPWWSIDYFYLGYGYGYRYNRGYGYADRFSVGWSSFGPSFGFSWSSGYGYPGPWYGYAYNPWYGYAYDPWYRSPWPYGWNAPYRHHRGYDRHAWNAPYRRERYDHDRYSGYRDQGRYDNRWDDARRNSATLDPDIRRRNGGLRQTWRADGPGEDREIPRMRGVEGAGHSASRVAMPSRSPGEKPGMTVRSRSGAKQQETRAHPVNPGQRAPVNTPPSRSGVVSVVSANPGRAGEVRSAGPGKSRQTRMEAIPIAPAPGRVVTPSRQAPSRAVSAPPGWRPSNSAPAPAARVYTPPPAQAGARTPTSPKAQMRAEPTRMHRADKDTRSSRRGSDSER